MGVADGTADVVWAAGVALAVVVAVQVCSFKGPARETDQKWAKRPCRHVTAANAGSKSVF